MEMHYITRPMQPMGQKTARHFMVRCGGPLYEKVLKNLSLFAKQSICYSSLRVLGYQQRRVITMSELSQGAYLAWRLAAGETARTLHPRIEKEFVFIGLCGLSKWLRTKIRGENAPLRGQALHAVSTEAQAIEEALTVCAVTPDLLCHAVRTALGKGLYRHGEEIVHRS